MTIRLDGKACAAALMVELKVQITQLAGQGITPGLAVILVGDDPASKLYVRNKERRAEELGVRSTVVRLPESTSQAEVLAAIAKCNRDPDIDGVLVQLPLPPQVSATAVIDAISPEKDVDGFHPVNMGHLWRNEPGIVASTPYGIMQLLTHYQLPVAGKHAVIVGRSTIVGRPLAALLLNQDATVTLAHSKTHDLGVLTRTADLLVAATGQAHLITADMVKPGAVVIDVGMDRDAAGKLVGDVAYDEVYPVAGAITPVPGGVGPMTIAALMMQTVASAERRANG